LLSPLGEFFAILRDAKHYRLNVRVQHLHGDRAGFLCTANQNIIVRPLGPDRAAMVRSFEDLKNYQRYP
jgi:hypothetical protein